MAASSEDNIAELLAWRQSVDPINVDVVGDFAGKELFAIHGESLIAHCINEAKVDFEDGFQLLHAVHAVEAFLAKLEQQGCNFHILWLDSHENLSVPVGVAQKNAHKYLLARAVLIEHLQASRSDLESPGASESSPPQFSFRFPSLSSDELLAYERQHSLHYVMCLDGKPTGKQYTQSQMDLLTVMQLFVRLGHSIALMNTVEFRSSKVYASVAMATGAVPDFPVQEPSASPSHDLDGSKTFEKFEANQGSTKDLGRGEIAVIACSEILSAVPDDTQTARQAAAFLTHITLLEHGDVAQRSCPAGGEVTDDGLESFLEKFSTIATHLVKRTTGRPISSVFDLVDGRLFLQVLKNLDSLSLPGGAEKAIEQRIQMVKSLSSVDLSDLVPAFSNVDQQGPAPQVSQQSKSTTVLPFNHPVMDKYLEDVKLETDGASEPDANSKVFLELTHWHNAKKPVDPKHGRIMKPTDPKAAAKALRRNQWFMADTIAYSASLTNASGKNIDPETVVIQKPTGKVDAKTKASNALNGTQVDGATASKEVPKSGKEKALAAAKARQAEKGAKPGNAKKPAPKSNKEKALEAAAARQAEKGERKSSAIVTYWQERCREFEKEKDPLRRFSKATKYLSGLVKADVDVIGSEVSLYVCDVLGSIRKTMKDPNSATGLSILALLWATVQSMQSLPLTPDTQKQLEIIATAISFPLSLPAEIPRPVVPPGYRLLFKPSIEKPATYLKLPMGAQQFQLEKCGPYLERTFDSAEDPRVPFRPDAWQRQVLDAIDADKSLLVVAPTSSGKTFISFYAMKKILRANDDDVIVYVAPTKALVNQIAAEIQARFSKTYGHGEGKSVWAIHTRDYRVNNSSGCQVLVTVPDILQIMLLAPSNAQKPNSWSRRVKRIIFDEVHCIGQAEDGVVWEQLLLLAPCPIIALSATVGNPLEFKEWLAATQKTKGFELEMVVHTARYSDLRKYMYLPPPEQKFKGLTPVENLPIPGLDTHKSGTSRFVVVHPIGAIGNKDPEALSDIGLESRDCLLLWEAMHKHATPSYPVPAKLSPQKQLPSLIKKSDVINWETALKDQLRQWMVDSASPFKLVRKELEAPLPVDFDNKVDSGAMSRAGRASPEDRYPSVLPLLIDLRSCGALPALLFNYDRIGCETALMSILEPLKSAEEEHRNKSPEWVRKMEEYTTWKRMKEKAKETPAKNVTKADLALEQATHEASAWESFDPDAPLQDFSFGDHTKVSKDELEARLNDLKWSNMQPHFIDGLRRGLGVHHAGMNRKYRQAVEILFRKGFLTCVIATGTLALGINMPCKTVVFFGDSVYLTALNYRQASGRAGRRGFDVLGNVVFHGLKPNRANAIMSSRLPDLKGQFPTSVTLILRLCGLLHGTNNSEFASKAVDSLLTQSNLYLGGPSSEMAIKHHLRFSVEYLRRQNLLSAQGVPLNFAGLVGHLYFTENAVFAFHSLLKSGYFHDLCADLKQRPKEIMSTLTLVLCHLFCRIPCPRYTDQEWLDTVVHKSPSAVLLPRLPEQAETILHAHNRETLDIFETYVRTYVDQSLQSRPDDKLPFTKCSVAPTEPIDLGSTGIPFNTTTIRSPFAALSGFTDEFKSIHELCSTVRDGVFLEESAVPYIPIYPAETNNVPFNAYIYDFFKHGDMTALVRDNGIKGGHVWFLLKDFSMVLATIVTSLANFLNPNAATDDADMVDIQDAGDIIEEDSAAVNAENIPVANKMAGAVPDLNLAVRPMGKKKKKVVDSWDDEASEEEAEVPSSNASTNGTAWNAEGSGGKNLTNVHEAFKMLQEEFDTKFRKVWA